MLGTRQQHLRRRQPERVVESQARVEVQLCRLPQRQNGVLHRRPVHLDAPRGVAKSVLLQSALIAAAHDREDRVRNKRSSTRTKMSPSPHISFVQRRRFARETQRRRKY